MLGWPGPDVLLLFRGGWVENRRTKLISAWLVGVLCADDSDSLYECEEFYPESLLEKLPGDNRHIKMTKDEVMMKRTYSYDPE